MPAIANPVSREENNTTEQMMRTFGHRRNSKATPETSSSVNKNTSNAWVIRNVRSGQPHGVNTEEDLPTSFFPDRSQLLKKVFDINQMVIKNLPRLIQYTEDSPILD